MILAFFLIVGSTSFADGPRPKAPAPPPTAGAPPPQAYYGEEDDGCYEDGCDDGFYGYGLEIETYYGVALPGFDPYVYYYCDYDIYNPCDQIVWVDGYPRFPYPRVVTPYFNLQRWYGAWGPQLRRLPYYGGGRWSPGYARGGYVEGGGLRGGYAHRGFVDRGGFVGGGGFRGGAVAVPRGGGFMNRPGFHGGPGGFRR